MATVGGVIVIMLAFIYYLLPAIISSEWHTKHFDAILFTHLVLGWTVFGWIAALIWAIVETPQEATGAPPSPTPEEPRLSRHESGLLYGRPRGECEQEPPSVDRELDDAVLQIKKGAEPFGPGPTGGETPLLAD